MTTIVCVGACYLDTILTVPHFPEEDSKLRATSLIKRRGGNCPNTLEVLQQLVFIDSTPNSRLLFLGTLPARNSPATKTITDSLKGIDFSHCIYREECNEAASSYIIKSEAQDSRTIVNYNELPEMTVTEFIGAANAVGSDEGGGKGVWWHFEGRIPEVTLSCIKHLRTVYPQATVSVEVEKPGRDGLEELAAEADVVFFSKSWVEAHGYTTPQPFLEHMWEKLAARHPILFCTWGSKGATSCQQNTVGFAQPPAGMKVVDPVGAGDTFIAGVLYSLAPSPRKEVSKALQLGVLVAGEKVRREGFQGLEEVVSGHMAGLSA